MRAFAIAVALCGCTTTRGTGEIGDSCRSDFDCARGYCIASTSDDSQVCSVTCADASDCPDHWSCSGVTGRGVVVCVPGPATPFGY